MFAWFRKKKDSNKKEQSTPKNIELKPINYPAQVILLWAKAVEGDEDTLVWLKLNGYESLYHATNAIYLRQASRDWLMENGYAHLMAMINGAEGLESAQTWLRVNNMDLLFHMARAIDHEAENMEWLSKHATPDLIILARSIQFIKDRIEENHSDIHSFGKDL